MDDRLRAGIGLPSRAVTSQLGQLSLASLWVAQSSTSFGWGKAGNVTSAGWQVTLCDPVRRMSSRSGVAANCYVRIYFYFTVSQSQRWNCPLILPSLGSQHDAATRICS